MEIHDSYIRQCMFVKMTNYENWFATVTIRSVFVTIIKHSFVLITEGFLVAQILRKKLSWKKRRVGKVARHRVMLKMRLSTQRYNCAIIKCRAMARAVPRLQRERKLNRREICGHREIMAGCNQHSHKLIGDVLFNIIVYHVIGMIICTIVCYNVTLRDRDAGFAKSHL